MGEVERSSGEGALAASLITLHSSPPRPRSDLESILQTTRFPPLFVNSTDAERLFFVSPRVILDRDLASIYGVPTGRLNEAVKRNLRRIPDDFMFRLNREEAEQSRSQTAILIGRRGANMKYLPFAFTEHGTIQVANVLRSRRAVEMGIHVVRAFVRLRSILASNKALARQFAELERKVSTHDQAIVGILKTIRELMNPPVLKNRPIGFTANLDEKS